MCQQPGSPALTMSLLSTSAHCNDEDIQTGTPLPNYPRTDLKETSFHHFMYALACQCQTFAGQFVAAAGDAARRVALVAEADRALTELLEQFPLFRSSVEPYPPFDVNDRSLQNALPWMRYKVTLTLAHRRAIFHRLLLRDTDTAADPARQVSLGRRFAADVVMRTLLTSQSAHTRSVLNALVR